MVLGTEIMEKELDKEYWRSEFERMRDLADYYRNELLQYESGVTRQAAAASADH